MVIWAFQKGNGDGSKGSKSNRGIPLFVLPGKMQIEAYFKKGKRSG
jgi:hypothetical protein